MLPPLCVVSQDLQQLTEENLRDRFVIVNAAIHKVRAMPITLTESTIFPSLKQIKAANKHDLVHLPAPCCLVLALLLQLSKANTCWDRTGLSKEDGVFSPPSKVAVVTPSFSLAEALCHPKDTMLAAALACRTNGAHLHGCTNWDDPTACCSPHLVRAVFKEPTLSLLREIFPTVIDGVTIDVCNGICATHTIAMSNPSRSRRPF